MSTLIDRIGSLKNLWNHEMTSNGNVRIAPQQSEQKTYPHILFLFTRPYKKLNNYFWLLTELRSRSWSSSLPIQGRKYWNPPYLLNIHRGRAEGLKNHFKKTLQNLQLSYHQQPQLARRLTIHRTANPQTQEKRELTSSPNERLHTVRTAHPDL